MAWSMAAVCSCLMQWTSPLVGTLQSLSYFAAVPCLFDSSQISMPGISRLPFGLILAYGDHAEGQRHLTIVIDTNVLVEKLSMLQQICAVFSTLTEHGGENVAASVVVPSVVLAELDGLKRANADGKCHQLSSHRFEVIP